MRLTAIMLLLLSSSSAVFAQSRQDEAAIMQEASTLAMNKLFPYVSMWAISSTTVALDAGDQPAWFDQGRVDYVSRNAQAIEVAGITLPQYATIESLSKFGDGSKFDWPAFVAQHPDDTYVIRLSRPGFSDESHAVIMIETDCPKLGRYPLTVALQRTDGRWRAVNWQSTSRNKAVR